MELPECKFLSVTSSSWLIIHQSLHTGGGGGGGEMDMKEVEVKEVRNVGVHLVI